jgi:hypothetical protein
MNEHLQALKQLLFAEGLTEAEEIKEVLIQLLQISLDATLF